MIKDYDLVVIGSTLEAITAVKFAVELGARVALVLEQNYPNNSYTQEIYYQANNYLDFVEYNKFNIKGSYAETLSIFTEQNYQELSIMGIDVIFGNPEFCRLPKLALIVNERKLTSVSYVIATSSYGVIPHIEGIEKVNYLTAENLSTQENLTKLPTNILIIGDSITGIKLAQKLNNLDKKVTLLTPQKQILPYEDIEVSFLLQAVLESEGIIILTNSIVTQIRQIENSKWVQAENQAIETDEIIMATSLKKPNISGLNLEGVGVKLDKKGIKVNHKLQTTNPKIYACGDVIGGYNCLNIAQYEAKIAVKNALFFNLLKVNYDNLPYAIFTNPNIARVGLTEGQAKKFYGNNIRIIKHNYAQLPIAKLKNNTTGFGKLILLPNGKILGTHLIGENVNEFIGVFALAMEKRIKLHQINEYINCSFSYSEIINLMINNWNRDQFLQNKTIIDLLEMLFIWRRS